MVIGAYRQIIDRVHARGLRIIGGTLLPFRGAFYFSEDKEGIRQEVNAWILQQRGLRWCRAAASVPQRADATAVRLGRTVSSMPFSRNAASYFPRPRRP